MNYFKLIFAGELEVIPQDTIEAVKKHLYDRNNCVDTRNVGLVFRFANNMCV